MSPAPRDFPLPELLHESARAWLDGRAGDPVTPRPSATVMLLRERAGLEVFLLHRAATMAFAPSMVAFPGGGVDPRDVDPSVPWAGEGPRAWGELLGCGAEAARGLVCAAARECFEECGVLLAGPEASSVVADVASGSWRRDRERLLSRELSFAELLRSRGLVLRTDLLVPRAHWTTPLCEPRRYDTWFFAAALPEGQLADGASTEASRARWVEPVRVLAEIEAGAEAALPPTIVMLEQLTAAPDLASVLAERTPVAHVLPEPVEHDGRLWMRVG
ncbi:NUDIX hydrolase [Ornithinicoccus halotolerans]|uniref:NUDIX hydrolase n=1 Tax=Ornithinicoccus halotolerans TaxID=1748220 RepID=UPI001885ECC8|nr:NUDIX domain-containing protein [Ornithinicoccus halotolerans]